MLKFLRIITLPIFWLSVVLNTLFIFPFKDGKSYAQYLVMWKWAKDEDKLAMFDFPPDQSMERPSDGQASKKSVH